MNYIRISASYLFNIKLGDKYLLVKSERRNQYQPVGGCYKYCKEAEEFLNSIDAIPEKKSNGVDSLMDLRLLIPEENLSHFIEWFISGQDRETTFEREFNEELVSLMPEEYQELFDKIQSEKQKCGSFDIFYDEEKDLNSVKPMDIISITLTNEQMQALRKTFEGNPANLILASEEEIMNGYANLDDNTKVKIGGHTRNIIPTKELDLEL